MIFQNNRIYDILKWIGGIVLPALAVFIVTMGDTWNLQYANEISATVTALAVFLNALLGVSSIKYHQEEDRG